MWYFGKRTVARGFLLEDVYKRQALKVEEVRYYFGIIIASVEVISVNICLLYTSHSVLTPPCLSPKSLQPALAQPSAQPVHDTAV